MANYSYNQTVTPNLENEVDFDFFDDEISQHSDANNNAVIKSTQSDKKNPTESNNGNRTENKELKASDHDRNDDTEVEEEEDEELSSSNNGRSLNHSNMSSVQSSQSRKSTSENRVNASSLSKKSISQQKLSSNISSDEESDDVTSVSSLESDNLSEVLQLSPPPPLSPDKPKKKISKQSSVISKYHTHLNSSIDMDRIPTEVILQAMMRIHEERRHMQKMKPKWIDPNSKDYSMSGITLKMNLVPERIVSMPKKNVRKNPFFYSNDEIDKRLYHSAINRGKEKDRIIKENQAIKSRLQQIRPSRGITKEELLREYSKLNRFSVQPSNRSKVITITPSYRPHSSTNSINDLKVRRTHSSTAVSRFVDSRQSNSVKSTPKRVMSANSLTSKNSRHSNHTSINKRN